MTLRQPQLANFAIVAMCMSATACGDDGADDTGGDMSELVTPCEPDESAPVPQRDQAGSWQRVDLEGAVCSNGTPYPIFVNFSETSNNVVIMLEPGGACWDYASCSPDGGLRGAANPNGIAEGIEHMSGRWQFLPLMRPGADVNPAHDWNKIFIPYCTGDIHSGNNTITYTGPNGEEFVYHHNGHNNIQRAIEWFYETFEVVPKLLVTGCSAGGAGALLNYHFMREGITGVQCGYLLNDSGPIFSSDGHSGPLHAKIRESWDADVIIAKLADSYPEETVQAISEDYGAINLALADRYPQDRLNLTVYQRDLNYSLYSYESFHDFPSYDVIHEMWDEDLADVRAQYDQRSNLSYYMPFFRIDNCSHCVSIPPIGLDGNDPTYALSEPWRGSGVLEDDIDLQDYVAHLLDDTQPLLSYSTAPQSDVGFSFEEAAICGGL
jgi:hypothetical protein